MQRSRSSAIVGEIGIGFSNVRFGNCHARVPGAVAEGQVLQRALAALVADRAVERVVDEDELERRVLRVGRHLGGERGLDRHALGGGERAGGLRLRRPGRDLAEAHAAGADRRPEPRLVAEDGDLDPGRERRLDEAGALRHGDLDAVDRQRDELGRAVDGVAPASATSGRTGTRSACADRARGPTGANQLAIVPARDDLCDRHVSGASSDAVVCASLGATMPSSDDSPRTGSRRARRARRTRPPVLHVARDRIDGEVAERAERLAEDARRRPTSSRSMSDELRRRRPRSCSRICTIQRVPSRHGVHLPHDSCM